MAYFFDYICEDKTSIIAGGGLVNENIDGTVSVFANLGENTLTPIPMTKPCCEALDPAYVFNIDIQSCMWSETSCVTEINEFKVVLNPTGNDGELFLTDDDETCSLDISFDYLMQFDCADIVTKLHEAANDTVGLSETTIAEIQALEIQYDDCIAQQKVYDDQISELLLEIPTIPYVIECDNGLGVTSYCLTELGLQEWEIILGTIKYNTWLDSLGTNTSVYGCDQVNLLVGLNQPNGDLLDTCNVSINLRAQTIITLADAQNARQAIDCDAILTEIDSLKPDIPCSTVSSMLETLNVCMRLDIVNPDTNKLETAYEDSIFNIGLGNLPTYLEGSQPNTGLLTNSGLCTTYCESASKQLMEELYEALPQSGATEIQALVQNSLESEWLNYETTITDQTILDFINNKKIKISLYIKDCCVDFSILIDRINLNKTCSKVTSEDVRISKSPSFDMIRVCDNKKSWLSNEEFKHREFDLKFRDTQYDINNHRLAINSKEVNLDINPANAIEQDLSCYINDNPCILTGTTEVSGTCGDNGINLIELASSEISGITSLKEFTDTINSELISVKGWKTMSAYPTLKLLYDRYMNSTDYCDTLSSQFGYCDMLQFSELIGTYWVDLIEQVVPATTIWGSTYVYGNALWDQQKITYKKYSMFSCSVPDFGGNVVSPSTAFTSDVEVEWSTLPNIEYYNEVSGSTTGTTFSDVTLDCNTNAGKPSKDSCTGIAIVQINCGSEFVGTIIENI